MEGDDGVDQGEAVLPETAWNWRGMVADRSSQGPVRAKEVAVVLGLEPTPAKVEGVGSKARRLAERGWPVQETSGMFSVGRGLVAGPGGGSFA
ncbi:hypothetical protein [Streptomyces sp. NPDC048462]|uniref:hypothetical protein n=1 Tax=Streptomyces sp. NPDC048462 TaxID=3365555 RepID=UPI003721EC72